MTMNNPTALAKMMQDFTESKRIYMPDYPEDRKLAPGPPQSLDEKWYKWAGVPIGVSYSVADQKVTEAVERLERERDLLLYTLQQIKELSFARDAHRALQEVREITIDTLKEG